EPNASAAEIGYSRIGTRQKPAPLQEQASMTSTPKTDTKGDRNLGLCADALGFGEAVIMGIAGIGPAYSVAARTASLIGVVGVLAPSSLLYCGLIMFGVAFAFRHLNRRMVNAGAAYAWVGEVFSPVLGFFAGWALLVNSTLFMVSGTLPAGAATLKLLAPS